MADSTKAGWAVATLPTGSKVRLTERATRSLRFLPPLSDLTVVVHPAALRAPYSDHTQLACISCGELVWLGALGEDLLEAVAAPCDMSARATCAARLLVGSRLWEVVRPGLLVQDHVARPLSTIYDGSALRPWVIIGETADGAPIAAPLNEPSNPKWFTPEIPQAAMSFPGNIKNAQLELAYIWTLPANVATEGAVLAAGVKAVEAAIRGYVDAERAEEDWPTTPGEGV